MDDLKKTPFPDTFPTYTLHNRVHACNVVGRMGDLPGKQVKDITALEGALLIPAAYLHDIGMVFTEEERTNIQQERHFDVQAGTVAKLSLSLPAAATVP